MSLPIDYALSYARLGWRLMWAPRGLKHPVMKGWQENATTNMAVIAAWYRDDPTRNVCVITGQASNLWVLDIDDGDGKSGSATLAALERQHGNLPRTYAVGTGGGGVHYYWSWAGLDYELTNKAGRLGNGLDIRANGGQVVAPPSWSEKGAYVVLDNVPVAAAPAWLIGLLRDPYASRSASPFNQPGHNGSAKGRLTGLLRTVLHAEEGRRNAAIHWAACRAAEMVAAKEITREQAEEALSMAAGDIGISPIEAMATIRSAFRSVA
ncbi:bifunctional DNA primase/polymerase [Streptomyces ureilyticus]|uniref:DNA primase/polymerase bifunctional N-terminal domain-containing protein n=1 Tax=Streptomyces ureilyticus TaxID=1775131 RepID=A0ABX0E3P7_9ACTN|nr:hypothetical protein [Streptomyces ureilyticus]